MYDVSRFSYADVSIGWRGIYDIRRYTAGSSLQPFNGFNSTRSIRLTRTDH